MPHLNVYVLMDIQVHPVTSLLAVKGVTQNMGSVQVLNSANVNQAGKVLLAVNVFPTGTVSMAIVKSHGSVFVILVLLVPTAMLPVTKMAIGDLGDPGHLVLSPVVPGQKLDLKEEVDLAMIRHPQVMANIAQKMAAVDQKQGHVHQQFLLVPQQHQFPTQIEAIGANGQLSHHVQLLVALVGPKQGRASAITLLLHQTVHLTVKMMESLALKPGTVTRTLAQ